jgi:hypothetical protein
MGYSADSKLGNVGYITDINLPRWLWQGLYYCFLCIFAKMIDKLFGKMSL